MANVFDNAVKGYTIGLNNKLNAQKAYIDSYITGINARNAVNQEARTKDQYWNYTNPLNNSNLANMLAKNNIETGILTNQDFINNIQGYSLDNAAKQYKLGHADMDNLANYIETQKQNSTTGLNNSKIAASGSAEALSVLPMSQKLSRNALVAALGRQPTELEFAKFTAEQNLANAKNPQNVTTTTPASGLPSNQYNTQPNQYGGDLVDLNSSVQIMQPTVQQNQQQIPLPTGQQTGQVNLNSNPFYQNYSADQLQSALGNLTSSTDSILGSTPDILLSPERRARKIAFNQNYERMIQARDAKIAEQKAQQQIENQAYLKRLTDKALERQRTNSGLK